MALMTASLLMPQGFMMAPLAAGRSHANVRMAEKVDIDQSVLDKYMALPVSGKIQVCIPALPLASRAAKLRDATSSSARVPPARRPCSAQHGLHSRQPAQRARTELSPPH